MPSVRIKKELNQGIYYLTFTVRRWYYIFDRHDRWDILVDSLKYCQKNKKLKIHAFVFMLNHIHLIISSPDISGFVRDFKKHTAFEIMKNLKNTEPQVAELFQTKDDKYQIWEKTNMPKIIETEKFLYQKILYIHDNPVRKKYVTQSEHWQYSSAFKPCMITLDEI